MTFKDFLENYPVEDYSYSNEGNCHIFHKDEWHYLAALEFQEAVNSFVYENPKNKVFILTSHPEVLTMGRGLQRNQIEEHGLIDFDNGLTDKLDVELVTIKRGGGLTFHHPGQLIVYPIVHITEHKMRTIELINSLFKQTVNSIYAFDNSIEELDYDRALLGLWKGERKLASMGIQLKRFVSMHGMALNVYSSELMQNALKLTHPCGLPGSVYNDLYSISTDTRDMSQSEFRSEFINEFKKNLILI